MRKTYLAPECAEGPEACTSYGNLWEHETWRGVPQVRVTLIDEATGSDYSGGLHTRSNYEVMLADADMRPHLIDLYGGYGTYGLAYRGTWEELRDVPSDDPRAGLRDAIAALADYPILDDDHHSNMEREKEGEAWADYGRQDFLKALVSVLDELDPEHEHDDDALAHDRVDTLWREGCEAYNVNGGYGYTDEEGGGIYFYVEDWCDEATYLGRDLGTEWGRKARAAMRDKLIDLARICRTPAEPES